MGSPDREQRASFRLVSPEALAEHIAGGAEPLILDIRRRAAFAERPQALPGAVALLLDENPLQIPDVPRDRPVVCYCLCHGETSSTRVARWLAGQGYENVQVLRGGLDAWRDAGLPIESIDVEASRRRLAWKPLASNLAPTSEAHSREDDPFLSLLAGQRLETLPQRRELTVLFVDMVDSTRLLNQHTPEEMLSIVQAFMEVVVEVGGHHCGDVHDFEGDGALLYFAGLGEALPAAFDLRERLLARRRALPALPLARLALDSGPVVLGVVGGRFRRSVALIGSAVPRAARILKLAPPGGIITTETVVKEARETSPDLVRLFVPLNGTDPLRGFENEDLRLYLAPPPGRT